MVTGERQEKLCLTLQSPTHSKEGKRRPRGEDGLGTHGASKADSLAVLGPLRGWCAGEASTEQGLLESIPTTFITGPEAESSALQATVGPGSRLAGEGGAQIFSLYGREQAQILAQWPCPGPVPGATSQKDPPTHVVGSHHILFYPNLL